MLADDKGVPKEEVKSWSGYPGGAPCNVACGCAQLDIPVTFVSCLGKDKMGDELTELMQGAVLPAPQSPIPLRRQCVSTHRSEGGVEATGALLHTQTAHGALLAAWCAGRGVDVSAVRRVEQPTRDVYVVRTATGDRIFDSFGQDTTTYCDCFIDADHLPVDKICAAKVLVLGTLGLAYPVTAEAMRAAVAVAKAAQTVVLVDVNWRPVFFEDPDGATKTVMDFAKGADVVKITDEEAEWGLGIPAADALAEPAKVCSPL